MARHGNTIPRLSRRSLLQRGSAIGVLALTGSVSARTVGALGERSVEPYGRLSPPDHHGLRLPAGFTARIVARTGDRVAGTDYRWHDQPDGGACFATPDGGFVYVSNSEVGSERGGAGAIRFDDRGDVVDAYRILDGSNRNCSGGATPWGTWLSCEENGAAGNVFECDPLGERPARRLPQLGSFNHEAVVVVPAARALFMTEDARHGRLYRFTPTAWPNLDAGTLEAASVSADGSVSWVGVSADEPARSDETTPFDGGEGAAAWADTLFVATKGDQRIWRYDTTSSNIEVAHDCVESPNTVLDSVDNLAVDPATGDLLVAKDGPTIGLAVVTTNAHSELLIAGLVHVEGHDGSEMTGPAMSPDRTTLMVSSQRGSDGRGLTYAITGPFRGADEVPPELPSDDTPQRHLTSMVDTVPKSALKSSVRVDNPGRP